MRLYAFLLYQDLQMVLISTFTNASAFEVVIGGDVFHQGEKNLTTGSTRYQTPHPFFNCNKLEPPNASSDT